MARSGHRIAVGALVLLAGAWLCPPGFAAETVNGASTQTTQVILTLNSEQAVRFKTRVEADPPTIVLDFPGSHVSGSLPERSVLQHGVISEIRTQYRISDDRSPVRIIDSVHIEITGSYRHRVRAEPGSIIIEIEHPAGIVSELTEIGLPGGTVLTGFARGTVTDRFRAMQDALTQASPTRWTWRVPSAPGRSRIAARVMTPAPRPVETQITSEAPTPLPQPQEPQGTVPIWLAITAAAAVLVAGGMLLLWLRGRQWLFSTFLRSGVTSRSATQPAAGLALIEQFVWRAFERSGYTTVGEVELFDPRTTMRIIAKDETQRALICLVNGPFFEKHTIEQCIRAIRQASIDQGFVVTSGSFTVPAQRAAKEAGVTLIGRDELVELLSAGATSEHFSKQIEALHVQLDDSKAALARYTEELSALRRQRNEASWVLGEERAKRAKLEAQASEVSQRLTTVSTESQQSHGELDSLHRRWEESQWYLGEARAQVRYLEEQISQLQEIVQAAEATRQDRDRASATLGEERIHREQLTAQLQALTTEIKQAMKRERVLQDQIDRLRDGHATLPSRKERRTAERRSPVEAMVELRDQRNRLLVSGTLRDLSGAGVGFDSERACRLADPITISLQLLGHPMRIRSKGQLVWQMKDTRTSRYHSGCRFMDLSESNHRLIEHTIAAAAP